MWMRNALFLLAFALLGASCMRAEVTIDVEPNGSGTVEVTAGIDVAKAEQFEVLLGDVCGEMVDAAAEDVAINRFDVEGFCGIRGNGSFAHPDQIDFEARKALGVAAEDFLVSPVRVEETDTGWSFSYEFVPLDVARGVSAAEGGDLAAELLGVNEAELTVRLRLPGEIIDHNGTSVTDDFVEWELEAFGEPVTLMSVTSTVEGGSLEAEIAAQTSEEPSDSNTTLYIIIGVAAVAVLGLIIFGISKRRSSLDV
jgi:hypothetical protein